MDYKIIKDLCDNWDGSKTQFTKIVSSIMYFGIYPEEVASEHEVYESTLKSWASGLESPSVSEQKKVVAYIGKTMADYLDETPRKMVGRKYSTKTELNYCPLALYKVYWKSGGSSLASVGFYHDGVRWLAPTNWTTDKRNNPCGDMSKIYDQIDHMVLVAHDQNDVFP